VFESYLIERRQPLIGRAVTTIASIAIHVGAVALILFLSLFYVEELPEPQVTVTFFSAQPPPPPPPPPPPAPKAKARPKAAVARPRPRPEDVQPPDEPPPEKPKDEDEPEPEGAGDAEGVEGGVEGGVPGGIPQKAPPPKAPKKPVYVRRQVVEKLKLKGEMPQYLPMAKRAGVQGIIIVRLCLWNNGTVNRKLTKILKGIPLLDDEVLKKVRTWRYRPYKVDGKAVPVCFPVKFVFRLR
jgi:protein TonB